MDTKELFTKISEVLEKLGIKEALKNPTVVETIYNVMSQHGMKVDKTMFNLVVMGFASAPADKLGDLFGLVAGALSGAQASAQGGAANPLAALGALGALAGALGGAAQPQAQQQQAQPQAPTAADLLGGLAKALSQNK